MPVLPSYRPQSIDLHSKSTDWFLYEGNTGILWVKYLATNSYCYRDIKSTKSSDKP